MLRDPRSGTKAPVTCLYIDNPAVVKRTLEHLEQRSDPEATPMYPARAPPPAE